MIDAVKKHKAGIISGIIASAVFLYLLQPIIELSAKALLFFYSIAGGAFLDKIYAQVAHLETINYAFLIILLLITPFALVFLLGGCSNYF